MTKPHRFIIKERGKEVGSEIAFTAAGALAISEIVPDNVLIESTGYADEMRAEIAGGYYSAELAPEERKE